MLMLPARHVSQPVLQRKCTLTSRQPCMAHELISYMSDLKLGRIWLGVSHASVCMLHAHNGTRDHTPMRFLLLWLITQMTDVSDSIVT